MVIIIRYAHRKSRVGNGDRIVTGALPTSLPRVRPASVPRGLIVIIIIISNFHVQQTRIYVLGVVDETHYRAHRRSSFNTTLTLDEEKIIYFQNLVRTRARATTDETIL